MDYCIHQLAIHELVKSQESSEASLKLNNQLSYIDEKAEQLIQGLHQTFSKKNDILQGLLASPEDALFPAYFKELEEDKFSGESFLQFSVDAMLALQLSLQGVVGAKGGYLVFAHYDAGDQTHLGIFLLRDSEGLVFVDEGTGELQLNTTTYLDIDRLALAARVNINTTSEDFIRVEVIKHARSQKDISAYFLNWLAIEETIDSKEMTTHFLEAVNAIPKPVDEETGELIDNGVFREQVTQFAMKNPSKTINVAAFEERFYGEEEKPLQTYFSENEIAVNEEFRFDRGTIRNYEFHKFKGQGLYFGCKHAFFLSGKVKVENGQIVIDDEDLVEQIMDILQDI